jgi:hypothetical protein
VVAASNLLLTFHSFVLLFQLYLAQDGDDAENPVFQDNTYGDLR